MSEIQTRLEELIGRLETLGASDEEIDSFVEGYPEMTDEQQERLFRMDDHSLYAAIAESRGEADYFATAEEVEAREVEAELIPVEEELDDDAWNLLANTVPAVIQLVGTDRDLAARCARLEATADKPRTGLISRLLAVAGGTCTGEPDPEAQEATEPGSGDVL